MVARSLLDTLREVCDDERDCIAVLERISRLADDSGICLCRESFLYKICVFKTIEKLTVIRNLIKFFLSKLSNPLVNKKVKSYY